MVAHSFARFADPRALVIDLAEGAAITGLAVMTYFGVRAELSARRSYYVALRALERDTRRYDDLRRSEVAAQLFLLASILDDLSPDRLLAWVQPMPDPLAESLGVWSGLRPELVRLEDRNQGLTSDDRRAIRRVIVSCDALLSASRVFLTQRADGFDSLQELVEVQCAWGTARRAIQRTRSIPAS